MPFNIIRTPGQSNIIADQNDDILDIVAGSGIQITTNAAIDTITITATGVSLGATGYSGSVGFTGSKGNTGGLGQIGYTGCQGDIGQIGYSGSIGSDGFTGSQGTGFTGSRGQVGYGGSVGSQGTQGYTGSNGDIGFYGSQGLTGYSGSIGETGFTGSVGIQGDFGYTGSTGPTGPSGQGLINQTIILDNVAASTVTDAAVPEWSASYTGTGGQLLIIADINAFSNASASRNWYLKKNGTTVATGTFYFNNANVHTTMPSLKYIDTSGSTSAATWSITIGSGLYVDVNDHATILVTEYTGITDISTGNITATGNVTGGTLISTAAGGIEGGEIHLAKPQANTTIDGTSVIIDVYQNRLRIFESGGNNRGGYFDLTTLGNSVSTNLDNLTYFLEAYANETYTLPGAFTEDVCRYSIVSSNVNVSSSWFNTSTYTFTPQKAGYWEITASYDVYRNSEASLAIKKNLDIVAAAGSFNAVAQQVTKIIYLNGSTDYVNIVNVGGAALSRAQYDSRSWFQARWIGT